MKSFKTKRVFVFCVLGFISPLWVQQLLRIPTEQMHHWTVLQHKLRWQSKPSLQRFHAIGRTKKWIEGMSRDVLSSESSSKWDLLWAHFKSEKLGSGSGCALVPILITLCSFLHWKHLENFWNINVHHRRIQYSKSSLTQGNETELWLLLTSTFSTTFIVSIIFSSLLAPCKNVWNKSATLFVLLVFFWLRVPPFNSCSAYSKTHHSWAFCWLFLGPWHYTSSTSRWGENLLETDLCFLAQERQQQPDQTLNSLQLID